MTKLEKFLEGVEKLRTPQNTKKIDALIEGTNLIASEYRKRKAKEEKARLEAEGFKKLDQHRIDSGLSNKAFVEGVGKTIIKSNQPDDVKTKLMESLDKYTKYLTESSVEPACRFCKVQVNDIAKEYLANNDINGLLHAVVLPHDSRLYNYDAIAYKRWTDILSSGKPLSTGDCNIQASFLVTRKLIDTDHEKLFVIVNEYNPTKYKPLLWHYADTSYVVQNKPEMNVKDFTESVGNAIIKSDYSYQTKQDLLEGLGSWIKDKCKTYGRSFGTSCCGKTYYDEPEVQEKFIDELVKTINKVGYNKFSKKYDFMAEKVSGNEVKGKVTADLDTVITVPFSFVLKNTADGDNPKPVLTFMYQMPGQTEKVTSNFNMTPDVKSYIAIGQMWRKLDKIRKQLSDDYANRAFAQK